jgi:hypothetical protein
MPGFASSKGIRHLAVAAAVAAGLASLGATENPWPVVAKADRIASPADCRSGEAAATIDCLGVVLPDTAGEIIEVAPGLSIVGQVPG